MKKIINTYGIDNDSFKQLDRKMRIAAENAGFSFEWYPLPLMEYKSQDLADVLIRGDVVLIDIIPMGENEFAPLRGCGKLLITLSAGYEHIDLISASRNGVAVACTPGANTLGVAELALSLILGCRRFLIQNDYIVRNCNNWSDQMIAAETVGCSTVGLVGFGSIGKALARLLVALGCRVIVYARRYEEVAKEIGIEYVTIEDLFRLSDVVSIHVAYNKQTHHMISRELMATMKKSAVLVNTSRGKIVDEDALAQLLADRKIAGAGLDVFGEEPLPSTSPFVSLNNVILSPHAGCNTIESTWRVYDKALNIAKEFYKGGGNKLLLNPDYKRI
jgi:lactate dehydrogenase-like 2-hydroxyacid dehydrogenase